MAERRALWQTPPPPPSGGRCAAAWLSGGSGIVVADEGTSRVLDRSGRLRWAAPSGLRGDVVAAEYNARSKLLAVAHAGDGRVALLDEATRSTTYVDTGFADAAALVWSPDMDAPPRLFIAPSKGAGLVVCPADAGKRLALTGRTKAGIASAAWSDDGSMLAIGGTDGVLTVHDCDGVLLASAAAVAGGLAGAAFEPERGSYHLAARAAAGIVLFDLSAARHAARGDGSVSARSAPRITIPPPRVVRFPGSTGAPSAHTWLPNGQRLVASFPDGSVATASVAVRPEGSDGGSWRAVLLPAAPGPSPPRGRAVPVVTHIAVSRATGAVALGGGNVVWIVNVPRERQQPDDNDDDDDDDASAVAPTAFAPSALVTAPLSGLRWSPDGLLLAAISAAGVTCLVGSVPLLYSASHDGHAIVLTGPSEATRSTNATARGRDAASSLIIPLPVEVPSRLAVCAGFIAVARRDRVWFMRVTPAARVSDRKLPVTPSTLLEERVYSSGVDAVLLSPRGVAAVMTTDGRLVAHRLGAAAPPATPAPPTLVADADVTAAAIGGAYLFYGTADGVVRLFDIDSWTAVAATEFRAQAGSGGGAITAVAPNELGTRAVVVLGPPPRGSSTDGTAVLFNPVDNRALPLPPLPPSPLRIVWDAADASVFVVVAGGAALAFRHAAEGMTGPAAALLGEVDVRSNGDMAVTARTTPLPPHADALCLRAGLLAVAVPDAGASGTVLALVPLVTHDALEPAAALLRVLRLPDGGGREGTAGRVHRFRCPAPSERPVLRRAFAQLVALAHLALAWDVAEALEAVDDRDASGAAAAAAAAAAARPLWLALAGRAMELLDAEAAARVYRRLGDAAMSAALAALESVGERCALAGHMALLFRDSDLAQELFLTSESAPVRALEMRVALRQWDVALRLAQTLSPGDVPALSVELARAHEGRAEHAQAAAAFETALQRATAALASRPLPRDADALEWLRVAALGGVARCALRLGDLRRGVELASTLNDAALLAQCARILEEGRHTAEAAALYRRASMWGKAVALLLQTGTRGVAAAAPLMQHVADPRVLASFARAKEAAKEYADAAAAFERAGEWASVVRLCVERLRDAERAREVVRATRSADGAAILAAHCIAVGDFRGGVEFLVAAHRIDDAFTLAEKHGEMHAYVRALRVAAAADAAGPDAGALMVTAAAGPPAAPPGGAAADVGPAAASAAAVEAAVTAAHLPAAEAARAAAYFESLGDAPAAAALFAEAGNPTDAMRLYLAAGDAFLDAAIAVAGAAHVDTVTRALVAHLMGAGVESPGGAAPRDPRYLFKLHMALGDTAAAGRTALVIARQEQELGNYKVAHAILFDAHEAVVRAGGHVPRELLGALALLHSYLLIRRLVRLERHVDAARLTLRVAASVSMFPAHAAPILTSTVIECSRAGLRRSAFEHACILMRPENRGAVEDKFRRKLEALVRRAPDEEEEPEPLTPCPFCEAPTPAYALACTACQSTLPFCVASGRHMTLEGAAQCPACHFPALEAPFAAVLAGGEGCPMCGGKVQPAPIQDARGFLRGFSG